MRGQRGDLLVRERDGGKWGELRSLGVPLARVDGADSVVPIDWPIAACGTGDGRVQLVARGPEGELLHGQLYQGNWSGFECIGLPAVPGVDIEVPMGLTRPPTACSATRGTMVVFAMSAAGELLHAGWDSEGFSEFTSLGIPEVPIPGPLCVCSCGHGTLALVTRGIAGDVLAKWWDGSAWSRFASIGAPQEDNLFYPGNFHMVPLSGPPVACGGGSKRLDVFARGGGGDLVHTWWNGTAWSRFASLGMPAADSPFTGASLACAWGRYQLDVFALASDGKLYDLCWDGRAV